MKTLPLLAAALAAAASLSACAKSDDAAFGQKVRAYLLAHPEVLEEVVDKLNQKKMAEAAAAQTAAVAALPANRAALERDPRDLVANPDGKITVVQFADYQCGHCKNMAPALLAMIKENPDVRFVFKEFPIFHGVSDTAAAIALTPEVKAKGLTFYRDWMSTNGLDDAAVDRSLVAQGLDPAKIRKEAQSPDIAKHIADNRALATTLAIGGTPTYFVGDIIIPGESVEALKDAIAKTRAAASKAA